MTHWEVRGSFLARRGDWQMFTKRCDAESAAQAREWALSEIGGCHGVKRSQIRIQDVTEAAA
jgi:ribosomal protein L20A (L18A)